MRSSIYGLVSNFAIIAILLSSSIEPLHSQENAGCGDKLEQNRRETQLRATTTELTDVIAKENGPGLLKFVGKPGFYVWGGLLSPRDIRDEISRKDGIYCLFFSTACLASAKFPNGAYVNSAKWAISYSDWLKKYSPTKTEIEMFYGGADDPCTANVAVRSLSNTKPDQLTFEIGFDYRDGSWQLRSTPAWPEGIARLSKSDAMTHQQIEVPIGNER